jgi:hypothetical protein
LPLGELDRLVINQKLGHRDLGRKCHMCES